MRPIEKRQFVQGPSLCPSDELARWLAELAERGDQRRIRLPVRIQFDEHRLRVVSTTVCPPPNEMGDEGLAVRLTDAMGPSIVSNVRERCSAPDYACCVWIEGISGRQGLMPGLATGGDRPVVTVTAIGETIEGAAPLTALVEEPG